MFANLTTEVIDLHCISRGTLEALDKEVLLSSKHGVSFPSLHEAYAVILEEVDELWDIVRLKKRDRVREDLAAELIHIAAMAVKALHSIDNFVGGTV
jgi:hypothetical protein